MRINTFKNYIGLCACKGCFKPLKVEIEVKTEKDGVLVIKNKFWLCHDCIDKAFAPDIREED